MLLERKNRKNNIADKKDENENKKKKIINQKHSEIWILVIVIVIAILVITSILIDRSKFENNLIKKNEIEKEIEGLKKETEIIQPKPVKQEEIQTTNEEIIDGGNISGNLNTPVEKTNVVNTTIVNENKTQKELAEDMKKVIQKSAEKWNIEEKDKGNSAIDMVKSKLGNAEYAYNLMDKLAENKYMVVVLTSKTREVIGYYSVDIEKNSIEKEE